MEFHKAIEIFRNCFPEKEKIFLHEPRFEGKEKEYLIDAIDSTFVSSVGNYVDLFEERFAKLTGVEQTTATVNGTSALQLALKVAGVKQGDEVITQALTFVASPNSISYNGASPIFIDVDLDTMGMSPLALREFLEEFGEKRENQGCFNKKSGTRISCCMPMHTFGFMCRIDEIIEICDDWDIPVVQDAAEALGSTYKGKSVGNYGLAACFSFNGNKIITSGGGGAIISRDSGFMNSTKHLSTTAKIKHAWDYEHDEVGFNFRLPNLNAALLCAQLEQLEIFKASKKRLYSEYNEKFETIGLRLKPVPEDTEWNYWLMALEFDNKNDRNLFLETTHSNDIFTRPIWRLMYHLKMYKGCQRDAQKNAEFLEDRIVNIPSSTRKTEGNNY